MNFEIERKFLLRDVAWQALVVKRKRIRQAYLSSNDKLSIRIRIVDDSTATLTFKSRGAALRRLELEYPIPVLEAEALIAMRDGAVVEKVRHDVPVGMLMWEVDVFLGDNEGLILAEVELKSETQVIEIPAWIGREVTGQAQYYNSSLTLRPFRSWPNNDRAAQELPA